MKQISNFGKSRKHLAVVLDGRSVKSVNACAGGQKASWFHRDVTESLFNSPLPIFDTQFSESINVELGITERIRVSGFSDLVVSDEYSRRTFITANLTNQWLQTFQGNSLATVSANSAGLH